MTVVEVLRKHGFSASEDAVALSLDVLLSAAAPGGTVSIASGDLDYLAAHAGVPTATPQQLAELEARTASRAAAEAARSLSRQQVAALLGVDGSRISHQVAEGRLYTYPGGSGRPVFPDWQFIDAVDGPRRSKPPPRGRNTGPTRGTVVVPHLPAVLAAVPARTHPVVLRAFMTTPNSELNIGGEPVSPCTWLSAGGDPGDVVDQAATLGEQM